MQNIYDDYAGKETCITFQTYLRLQAEQRVRRFTYGLSVLRTTKVDQATIQEYGRRLAEAKKEAYTLSRHNEGVLGKVDV